MFRLANAQLTVELLDPAADAARLGPRFCAGGYIWQVRNARGEPLVSGPEWPTAAPDPFNGQGLPESFRHRTLSGEALTWSGARGVALGAGEIAVTANKTVALVEPCRWTVEHTTESAEFTTEQTAAGFTYRLKRVVHLDGKRLTSSTELTNLGDERLHAEWFAHPFFALPRDGLAVAELPADASLGDNPGFALVHGLLRQKRRFTSQTDGHFDHVQLPAGQRLNTRIAHPTLGVIAFTTSFVPSSCVIWGNDRTFSLEPYQTIDLAPKGSAAWTLEYRFGA